MINAFVAVLIAYVQKEERSKVAKAVLLAQDIHEDSWDTSKDKYIISTVSAATQAVAKFSLPKHWITIISECNTTAWDDIQDWAKEQNKTA